jgi:hypothetical protein
MGFDRSSLPKSFSTASRTELPVSLLRSLDRVASHSFTRAQCYHIDSVRLPVIANCTDLGVSQDASFSVTPHINKIFVSALFRAELILKCLSLRDPILLTGLGSD